MSAVHPRSSIGRPPADTRAMEQHEYRERLSRDVAAWRRAGIIDVNQGTQMLARAGAGSANLVRALRAGWLAAAISLMGAFVLGAGVLLIVAANWQEMGGVARGR